MDKQNSKIVVVLIHYICQGDKFSKIRLVNVANDITPKWGDYVIIQLSSGAKIGAICISETMDTRGLKIPQLLEQFNAEYVADALVIASA